MAPELITTTVRLPADLHKALQELANSQERSLTGQIVYMLRKQMEEERKATTTH